MTWWVVRIVVVLGVVIGVIAGVGALLNREHIATRAARYTAPPETIWRAISDVEAVPTWWPDGEDVPLSVDESLPFRRLVTRIADPELPFGGTWTYEISGRAAR